MNHPKKRMPALAAALALSLCGGAVLATEVTPSAAPEPETLLLSTQNVTWGTKTESFQDPTSIIPNAPTTNETAESEPVAQTPPMEAGIPTDQEVIQEPAPETVEENTPEETPETTKPEPAPVNPDPAGTVSFKNLSKRIRSGNQNIRSLDETISAIQVTDYEELMDDIRDQLNGLADAQFFVTVSQGSFAASSLKQAYSSLSDTYDDLREGKLQDDNAAIVRQLENAQNQIVMAGESLYIALVELSQTDKTLQRNLAALDRTLEELNLRYEMGQISSLSLKEAKAGRVSLVSGQETLDMNQRNLMYQLQSLLGEDLTGSIALQPLSAVSSKSLSAMNLENDLEKAKAASYELFAAKNTLDDAQEDYKDAKDDYLGDNTKFEMQAATHTWQAAQHTYDATVESFELQFRTLYHQVLDYQQVLESSRTTLAAKKDSYAAAQLKYEQGTISKNDMLEAQDTMNAAQDTVNGAAIDLFSAYNNYRWAVDYGILN